MFLNRNIAVHEDENSCTQTYVFRSSVANAITLLALSSKIEYILIKLKPQHIIDTVELAIIQMFRACSAV